uniref:Uncharacterized protein n=1 Tax=Romanomermis culicivorax TaxID=13658 RepID=A0A915K3Z9_ROMCU
MLSALSVRNALWCRKRVMESANESHSLISIEFIILCLTVQDTRKLRIRSVAIIMHNIGDAMVGENLIFDAKAKRIVSKI